MSISPCVGSGPAALPKNAEFISSSCMIFFLDYSYPKLKYSCGFLLGPFSGAQRSGCAKVPGTPLCSGDGLRPSYRQAALLHLQQQIHSRSKDIRSNYRTFFVTTKTTTKTKTSVIIMNFITCPLPKISPY